MEKTMVVKIASSHLTVSANNFFVEWGGGGRREESRFSRLILAIPHPSPVSVSDVSQNFQVIFLASK